MSLSIANNLIIPLTQHDLPAIMQIERRAYDFPWTEKVFEDCLGGDYLCRGLYEKGELRAYAVLSIAVGECHILNVCVAPEFQGRGVASGFLLSLLDIARERQAEIVFLEVRASNIAALALYSKMGFSEIGRRNGYYRNGESREDALVLSLPLLS
ncbi:MAG: ribosomal-protein-alanine N-acetyltransferase [Moraxellaceae bacterium]|nr:MAG: ribosomal-protein-alanine N-acetyltransferase [Moraxellaceae bacterium]